MADNQTSLIYIDKNKLWFYNSATREVLSLDFPVATVKDMEVLNRELFTKQFESFLSVHKIVSSRVNFVISTSLLFLKDISGIEESKKDEAIREFVENVPFDNVANTTVHQDKTVRVIAINKDLLTLLKRTLEKNKFEIGLALPMSLVPNISIHGALDAQTAQLVLGASDGLKMYNLLDPIQVLSPLQSITENAADKKHPKRLPVLLSAFGGLISILVGVAVVSNTQPTIPSSQAKAPPKITPASLLVTPTTVITLSRTLQTLRIDLIHSSQNSSDSARLLSVLKTAGITDVKEVVLNSGALDTSQIIFSQAVPTQLQNQLVSVVKSVFPNFSTRVVSGLLRDVEIRIK